MPEGGRGALHPAPAEAPIRNRDAEERRQAGGGGEDTRPLEHRHNGGHIQARQDGGDARGGEAVRADERGLCYKQIRSGSYRI